MSDGERGEGVESALLGECVAIDAASRRWSRSEYTMTGVLNGHAGGRGYVRVGDMDGG